MVQVMQMPVAWPCSPSGGDVGCVVAASPTGFNMQWHMAPMVPLCWGHAQPRSYGGTVFMQTPVEFAAAGELATTAIEPTSPEAVTAVATAAVAAAAANVASAASAAFAAERAVSAAAATAAVAAAASNVASAVSAAIAAGGAFEGCEGEGEGGDCGEWWAGDVVAEWGADAVVPADYQASVPGAGGGGGRRRRRGRRHAREVCAEWAAWKSSGVVSWKGRGAALGAAANAERQDVDGASFIAEEDVGDWCPLPGREACQAGELTDDATLCQEAINMLDSGSAAKRAAVLRWMLTDIKRLALGRCSTRVVQKLIEVADNDGRRGLTEQLTPHIAELSVSEQANYVVQKMIEQNVGADLVPIVRQLHALLPSGKLLTLGKNKCGCRIVERLIEHCAPSQETPEMGEICDLFVQKTQELCRHQYGNFLTKHILEHGTPERRAAIAGQLLPLISQLATHRTASHVVQQALQHCDQEDKLEIVQRLLETGKPLSLEQVAASRYGSYVVEEIKDCLPEKKLAEVTDRLRKALEDPKAWCAMDDPKALIFFVRAAVAYGLEVPAATSAAVAAAAPAMSATASSSTAASWAALAAEVAVERAHDKEARGGKPDCRRNRPSRWSSGRGA